MLTLSPAPRNEKNSQVCAVFSPRLYRANELFALAVAVLAHVRPTRPAIFGGWAELDANSVACAPQ